MWLASTLVAFCFFFTCMNSPAPPVRPHRCVGPSLRLPCLNSELQKQKNNSWHKTQMTDLMLGIRRHVLTESETVLRRRMAVSVISASVPQQHMFTIKWQRPLAVVGNIPGTRHYCLCPASDQQLAFFLFSHDRNRSITLASLVPL